MLPLFPLPSSRASYQTRNRNLVCNIYKSTITIFLSENSKNSILDSIIIKKNDQENVMIEPSINSTRISLKIKQNDELEKLLCKKFSSFMMQRADHFSILRRKSIDVIFTIYFYQLIF